MEIPYSQKIGKGKKTKQTKNMRAGKIGQSVVRTELKRFDGFERSDKYGKLGSLKMRLGSCTYCF